MKVAMREHDGSLEMVVTAETYEEHILVNAFLREQERTYGGTAVAVSGNPHGTWSVAFGSCSCAIRAWRAEQDAKKAAEPCKHRNVAACSDLSLECVDCGETVGLDAIPVKP